MTSRSGGQRLASVDALRGAAALGVVAFHCAGRDAALWPGRAGEVAGRLVTLGWTGVMLFFVISGFCIHLGWARGRAAGGEPRVAFLPFWKRRARRLYPPYLAALGLYLAVEVGTGRYPLNGFAVYDVLMHLLMLHNLDSRTVFSVNGVFWTLAIEEQLYLAYFALLWLRRRGWVLTLSV